MKKFMKSLKKWMRSLGKTAKTLICAGIAVVLLAIAAIIIFAPKGGSTFDAETSLKEVIVSSEFRTAEFTYNSITEVKKDSKTKYHVSYNGTVKVGFNFDEVQIEQDEDAVRIIIPKMEIVSVTVDENMDYIFADKKYDTEKTYQEALNACKKDLEKKAKANQTLFETAKESAFDMISALVKPFESKLTEGQRIEIVFMEELEDKEVAE